MCWPVLDHSLCLNCAGFTGPLLVLDLCWLVSLGNLPWLQSQLAMCIENRYSIITVHTFREYRLVISITTVFTVYVLESKVQIHKSVSSGIAFVNWFQSLGFYSCKHNKITLKCKTRVNNIIFIVSFQPISKLC